MPQMQKGFEASGKNSETAPTDAQRLSENFEQN